MAGGSVGPRKSDRHHQRSHRRSVGLTDCTRLDPRSHSRSFVLGKCTKAIKTESDCDDLLQLFVNTQSLRTCHWLPWSLAQFSCSQFLCSCIFGPRRFDKQSPNDLREMCRASEPLHAVGLHVSFLKSVRKTVGCDACSWPITRHSIACSSAHSK